VAGEHPDRLQLYSLPTPNGVKVSIMLEETGLPYEPHLVDFNNNDQTTAEFLSLNPNNKIPAILDPDGPEGAPLPLFESGAILLYLAEKTGRLLPRAPAGVTSACKWVFFQVGRHRADVRPARVSSTNSRAATGKTKRPRDRYVAESRRLLKGGRPAPGVTRMDDGRRVQHRRHRHLPDGAQPGRFLRRGRARGIRRLPHVRRALEAFLRGRRWRAAFDSRAGS
jgi:GST-like protein